MPNESLVSTNEPLETATELERAGLGKKGSLWKSAKLGIIPYYLVGPKQTGVRFRRSEVLASLRRPVTTGKASNDR